MRRMMHILTVFLCLSAATGYGTVGRGHSFIYAIDSPDATGSLALVSIREYTGDRHVTVNGNMELSRFPGDDFNARRYNPVLAAFSPWDPLAEKYLWISPYTFRAGNPILFADSDGQRIIVIDNRLLLVR